MVTNPAWPFGSSRQEEWRKRKAFSLLLRMHISSNWRSTWLVRGLEVMGRPSTENVLVLPLEGLVLEGLVLNELLLDELVLLEG